MASPRRPSWWSFDGTLLATCVVIAVLSLTLTPTTDLVSVFGYEVPPICAVRNLTGYSCPGCGLTRSFVYLGHGELGMAWAMNKLGPFLYFLLWTQIPYRIIRLVRAYRVHTAQLAAAAD